MYAVEGSTFHPSSSPMVKRQYITRVIFIPAISVNSVVKSLLLKRISNKFHQGGSSNQNNFVALKLSGIQVSIQVYAIFRGNRRQEGVSVPK